MMQTGFADFLFFSLFVILSAVALSWQSVSGMGAGLVIQGWAIYGLVKLYQTSEPAREANAARNLPSRLLASLFGRRQREYHHIAERLRRPDSLVLLALGALLALCVPFEHFRYESLNGGYAILSLTAQIFCFGVIVFLSQIYAHDKRLAWMGFVAFACLGAAAILWQSRQEAAVAVISPLAWRQASVGTGYAVLPWVIVMVMCVSLMRALFHPARTKIFPLAGLVLACLMGAYDAYGIRGGLHYMVMLPLLTAVALAWARTAYGPLWSPFGGLRKNPLT